MKKSKEKTLAEKYRARRAELERLRKIVEKAKREDEKDSAPHHERLQEIISQMYLKDGRVYTEVLQGQRPDSVAWFNLPQAEVSPFLDERLGYMSNSQVQYQVNYNGNVRSCTENEVPTQQQSPSTPTVQQISAWHQQFLIREPMWCIQQRNGECFRQWDEVKHFVMVNWPEYNTYLSNPPEQWANRYNNEFKPIGMSHKGYFDCVTANYYQSLQDLLEARMEFFGIEYPTNENPNGLPIYKSGDCLYAFIDKMIEKCPDKDRVKWLKTFRNCVLPEEVKTTIEEALTVVLNAKKFKKWGIEDHFEKGLTNSILLYGPPGTGKTMIAEAFAAVLGKNLLKITNADIQSQIPGQAERNITENFNKAKKNNAVLMFDECDSLLYNRNDVGMILASEINHLLGCIENFKGVVIMTTNRLGKLDPALQRRIIAKVKVPFPTQEARLQIWKNLLPPKMPIGEINFEELSTAEISGGEIKNAILLAARKAIATNADQVTHDHLKTATKSVLKSKKEYDATQPKTVRHKNLTEGTSYGDIMGLNKKSVDKSTEGKIL